MPSVPGRFTALLISGMRRERQEATAEALQAAAYSTRLHCSLADESERYLRLCERAWLRWSRSALDSIIAQALKQSPGGPFHPDRILDAQTAAEARARCSLHMRLVSLAAARESDHTWEWRVEAARHVHASTQDALKVAASIDPGDPPTVFELEPGVEAAAETLAVAITAGFIHDGPSELIQTLADMNTRAAWEGDGG